MSFKFEIKKTKELCSHCTESKTTHRCPICSEPTCSKCKVYSDFQIYIPKAILVRSGTCKECKEELIEVQEIMTLNMAFQAIPQIAEQLSEHIKRFLEKFGIEFT